MTQPQNDPVENRLHMKRFYAVERRGRQQRLKFAIRDFETRGELYLSEEEMLADISDRIVATQRHTAHSWRGAERWQTTRE